MQIVIVNRAISVLSQYHAAVGAGSGDGISDVYALPAIIHICIGSIIDLDSSGEELTVLVCKSCVYAAVGVTAKQPCCVDVSREGIGARRKRNRLIHSGVSSSAGICGGCAAQIRFYCTGSVVCFFAGFYNRILLGRAFLIRIGYASPVRRGGGEAIVGFQSACNQQVDTILATLRILFNAVVLAAAGRVSGIGRCGYAQDFALRVVEGYCIDRSSGVVKAKLKGLPPVIRRQQTLLAALTIFSLNFHLASRAHFIFLAKYFKVLCRTCAFFNGANFVAGIAALYAILRYMSDNYPISRCYYL